MSVTRLLGLVMLAVLWPAIAAADARATTFYVASGGSDAADGRSPGAPLATLAAVNALDLDPADTVLLRGGDTFAGPLTLTAQDSGAAGTPVTIGSYGAGRATIHSADGSGEAIRSRAQSHVVLQDLRVTGGGAMGANGDGVRLENTSGAEAADIVVRRLEVSGFHLFGIAIQGTGDGSGFRDVTLTELDLHDNGSGGAMSWTDATDPNAVWPSVPVLHDVVLSRSHIHDNKGWPGANPAGPTGNGAVLSHVDGARMTGNVANDNGGLDDNATGPCALFTYESNQVRIDHNEAYGNRTGGQWDGCGFDLDDKVTNSVMEDNYSHDNDGAGFMWCNITEARYTGNVIRDNLSVGDDRLGRQAGIFIYQRADGLRVEHNTVITPTVAGSAHRAALVLENLPAAGGGAPTLIRDNALISRTGRPVVATLGSSSSRPDAVLQGNAYWSTAGAARFAMGATTLSGLPAFRAATGQERRGGVDVGIEADPLLFGDLRASRAPAFGDVNGIDAFMSFRPTASSPLRDAGVDTGRAGQTDLYGHPAVVGPREDIGAAEIPLADLSVAIGDTTELSPTATFTATITNAGPGDAVLPVLDLVAPAGVPLSAVALPGGWSCEASAGGARLRCRSAGELQPGSSSLRFSAVRVDGSTAAATVTASVAIALSADPVAPNDSSSAALVVPRPADAAPAVPATPGEVAASPAPAPLVVVPLGRPRAVLLSAPSAVRLTTAKTRVPVTVTCAARAPCTGTITVAHGSPVRLPGRRVTRLGRVSFRIEHVGRRTIAVPLPEDLLRYVAARGTLTVTVSTAAQGVPVQAAPAKVRLTALLPRR